MRDNRFGRLSAAQELFVENLAKNGDVHVVSLDDDEIGYVITDRKDGVVEIHIEDKALSIAGRALDTIIQTLGARRLFAQSFDPLAMSLGLARGGRAVTVGLLYRVLADPGFEPRTDIVARPAELDDISELAALSNDFFDDADEINDYMQFNGLMVYRGLDGNLIGAGVLQSVCAGRDGVDIGMVVNPRLRRRGYGVYIVRHLEAHCLARGRQPICGCSIDNIGSQRTLERSGFASIHRLVEFAL